MLQRYNQRHLSSRIILPEMMEKETMVPAISMAILPGKITILIIKSMDNTSNMEMILIKSMENISNMEMINYGASSTQAKF
jgi:hypothetical protein